MRPPRMLVLAGAVTVPAIAVAVAVYPSRTEFAPSNPQWNGLSGAVLALHLQPLRSVAHLPKVPAGTALVLIPSRPLSGKDTEALGRYLDGGGVVLLFDDSGRGNDLLQSLGVPLRILGPPLEDPLFAYRNRRFPRITVVTGPASQGVRALVLNHPTVLRVGGGVTVLAQSSLVSYLDTNGNHRQDPGEPHGPFVVAAAFARGAGTLVVVADSSLLSNAMMPLADNLRFVRNLVGLAGGGARVYLDTAHLPHAPLDTAKDDLDWARDAVAFPPVSFALVAAGVLIPWVLLAAPSRR